MDRLSGYLYRKSITLSRASGAVTDYQMKLLVGESAGASGADVDCGGKCLTTFNDLRFTAPDGTTLLSYWIESISGTTPNQIATVWIKFNSIGTEATTFYLNYGNSEAAAYSSIADTFILGDDFERGSNGDSIGDPWGLYNDPVTISTEQKHGGTRSAKFTGGDILSPSALISSVPVIDSTYAIRFRLYREHPAGNFKIQHGNASKSVSIWIWYQTEDIKYYDGSNFIDTTKDITADAWNLLEIRNINFTDGTYDIYLDDVLAKSGAAMATSGTYNGQCELSHPASTTGYDAYVDDFIVRNWRSTEPAWGSWGAEEFVTVEPDALSVIAALSGSLHIDLPDIEPDPLAVTASMSCESVLSFPDSNYTLSYVCYLTPPSGTELSALTIPMSSFQGRFKNGDPSYLSVVTPGLMLAVDISSIFDYSSAAARVVAGILSPGGDLIPVITSSAPVLSVYMVKTYADGHQISEQLMAVDLEDVRIDQGGSNQSITLEGHTTKTYSVPYALSGLEFIGEEEGGAAMAVPLRIPSTVDPDTAGKIILLEGATYKLLSNGGLRYRCTPNMFVRPGDVVSVNGDVFRADEISFMISVEQQVMEVAEA